MLSTFQISHHSYKKWSGKRFQEGMITYLKYETVCLNFFHDFYFTTMQVSFRLSKL